MASASSYSIWKDIERRNKEDQRNLLQWQLQARESILSFAEIKPGDHLVQKRYFALNLEVLEFDHHFLCIGQVKEDGKIKPIIIHYYNTLWNAALTLFSTFFSKLGSAIENLGKVQEMTLPDPDFITDEDLQAGKVFRVVWPEELRRYSSDEVIRRAKRRKDESWYDLAKNNCETFVMKCLCDLEISTQVTPAVKAACEVGRLLVKTSRQVLFQGFKVAVDNLDDIFLAATRGSPKGFVGLGFGSGVTVVSEGLQAFHDISEAIKKMDEGVMVKDRGELIKEVKDIIVSSVLRSGGSIVGMIAEQLLIPIPFAACIVGTLLGLWIAHFCSKALINVEIEWLDRLIDWFLPEKHQTKA